MSANEPSRGPSCPPCAGDCWRCVDPPPPYILPYCSHLLSFDVAVLVVVPVWEIQCTLCGFPTLYLLSIPSLTHPTGAIIYGK
eukprot:4864378-Pyramimonas_sp.AAC.3